MHYIGVDYGTKRLGLAVSDETGTLAFPHSVVGEKDVAKKVAAIVALAQLRGAEAIIVGESKNFAGERNPIQNEIDEVVAALRAEGFVVELESELFSSAGAFRLHSRNEAAVHREYKDKLDAAAAATILQSFLDRNKRVHA